MSTALNTDRELRVLDQSITAYSVLRDRYGRRDMALSIVALGGSIIVTGLAIAGDPFLRSLGISDPDSLRSWIAVAGLGLVVASVLSVRFDWGAKALLFAHAADSCGRLKGRYREALEGRDPSQPGRLEDVRREYLLTMSWLPRIPDRQFVQLKAHHRRKVALSRLVDKRPFIPLWYATLIYAIRDLRSLPGSGPEE